MRNYIYRKNKAEATWELYESQTDQVIDKFVFQDHAVKKARFFERGGGFAGWTPAFMLTPCNLYDNIDDKVADILG